MIINNKSELNCFLNKNQSVYDEIKKKINRYLEIYNQMYDEGYTYTFQNFTKIINIYAIYHYQVNDKYIEIVGDFLEYGQNQNEFNSKFIDDYSFEIRYLFMDEEDIINELKNMRK